MPRAALPVVLGEGLVHLRQAAVAALAQRRDLERLALEHGLAAELVARRAAKRALAAQLRVQLGLRLAGDDRRELAVAHHEPARRLAAVGSADVVEHRKLSGSATIPNQRQ